MPIKTLKSMYFSSCRYLTQKGIVATSAFLNSHVFLIKNAVLLKCRCNSRPFPTKLFEGFVDVHVSDVIFHVHNNLIVILHQSDNYRNIRQSINNTIYELLINLWYHFRWTRWKKNVFSSQKCDLIRWWGQSEPADPYRCDETWCAPYLLDAQTA